MSRRAWQILGSVSTILIVLAVAVVVFQYRTERVAAESYKVQAANSWVLAAGGYDDFASQILSLKPDSSTMPAVCHNAKVQLQNLNKITLAKQVPADYERFQSNFADAVRSNRRYYRKILDLCSGQAEANGSFVSSLFTLGQDIEDKYRQAYQLMPDIGTEIDSGISAEVNERLSKIAQPKKEAPTPAPRAAREIVRVPLHGYSPDFPPAIGSVVFIATPAMGNLNLREAPSRYAERVQGREVLASGERVVVLDRVGYWLYVQTVDGYNGYIRWWFEGTPYVRP